ncbi:MAG: hypothetical protein ACI8PT_000682 [Gammaproteobacteria bacterium]|jgi:hypothetical protein
MSKRRWPAQTRGLALPLLRRCFGVGAHIYTRVVTVSLRVSLPDIPVRLGGEQAYRCAQITGHRSEELAQVLAVV